MILHNGLEVTVTDEATCPVCGCWTKGCYESVGDDGRRRWTQPVVTIDKGQQVGGLVHIENGTRCTKDAAARAVLR